MKENEEDIKFLSALTLNKTTFVDINLHTFRKHNKFIAMKKKNFSYHIKISFPFWSMSQKYFSFPFFSTLRTKLNNFWHIHKLDICVCIFELRTDFNRFNLSWWDKSFALQYEWLFAFQIKVTASNSSSLSHNLCRSVKNL